MSKEKVKVQINSLEALERLIGGDSQLEFEIRHNVAENFAKKYLRSLADVEELRIIGQAVKEEVRKKLLIDPDNIYKTNVNDNIKQQITSIAKQNVESILRDAVYEAFNKTNYQELIAQRLVSHSESVFNAISDTVLQGKLDRMVEAKIKEKLGL